MRRILLAILISFVCCSSAVNTAAQTRKIDSPDVLKALLALPAPTPRQPDAPAVTQIGNFRDYSFYRRNNEPPDDAPVEDLIDFWTRWSDTNAGDGPTEAVRKRLLEACVAKPEILASLIEVLPEADSTPAKVKNIYDKALSEQQFDEQWRDKVKKWLVFNSTYFLNELITMASKAKEDDKDGDVDREDAVSALASVSWTNAEPILRGLMASGHPRSTALALSLYYQHAVDEKDMSGEERYRRDLQAIAVNRNQPGYARDTALYVLSLNEWSGRDEWYLGLFHDETLLQSPDSEFNISPLLTLFGEDEPKWIPIMAKLVEDKDMNVRVAAITCLLSVAPESKHIKEALTPLLPWLTNAAWADDSSNIRVQLIQKLGEVNRPESVSGLISIVETDDAEPTYARGFAAQALTIYDDPRAVPALKKALTKEKDEGQKNRIIKALVGSHGLSEREQLEALEEYATKIATPEGRADMFRYRPPAEEPLSPTLSIGKYLGQNRETPEESLISAVLARAEELKADKAAVADALIEVAQQWQGQQVELDIIKRIANGAADVSTITEAIQRKEKMREGLRTELQALASVAGAAQGVGAVLLDDPTLAQGVLNSEDLKAQIALLACARLTQTVLPVEMVGPFLRNKDPLLTQAAETYLLAEDSRAARDLLWARHPNEAFVTGWRENYQYGGNFEAIVKSEERLRAEVMKDDGPKEILALMSNLVDQGMVLRIYADKAIFTEYDDGARYRERKLSDGEVSVLKDYLTVSGFSERGPIVQWCHHGCPISQLLLVSKEKGRRVFNQGGWTDWQELQKQFGQLASGEGGKVHYKLEDEIKGLEVLYAGNLFMESVAQQGSELRVYVERPETPEEEAERMTTYNYGNGDDEEDEEVVMARRRRRLELHKSLFSWRVLTNDQPGAITSQPDFYSTFDRSRFLAGEDTDVEWEDGLDVQAQVLSPDSIIVANYDGLWRQFAGSKPISLGVEGASYSNPIVTRDGKWLLVAKEDDNQDKPRYIVRLNLQTGREGRINVPSADQLVPIAALPSGKVLVGRERAAYVEPGTAHKRPDKSDHYLVDPATGSAKLVTGEFAPLFQLDERFLQSTEKPDEFWAAIPDDTKNQTQIGRYSLKDFSFKSVTVVPQLVFNSMMMWVDASHAKVYLVYKGQLLRLPLQSTPK